MSEEQKRIRANEFTIAMRIMNGTALAMDRDRDLLALEREQYLECDMRRRALQSEKNVRTLEAML